MFRELASNKSFSIRVCGFRHHSCKEAEFPQNWLKEQNEFEYLDLPFTGHNMEVEKFVGDFFTNTDVYFTPYRKLSSTIDTPLLIQEAMAGLSAIITKPFGNLGWLYGNPDFLLKDDYFFMQNAEKLILEVGCKLKIERKRLEN